MLSETLGSERNLCRVERDHSSEHGSRTIAVMKLMFCLFHLNVSHLRHAEKRQMLIENQHVERPQVFDFLSHTLSHTHKHSHTRSHTQTQTQHVSLEPLKIMGGYNKLLRKHEKNSLILK